MDIQEEFPNYPRIDEYEVEEPYCDWHLSIHADCGGTYLWDMNAGMVFCDSLGAPEALHERFRAWSEKHEVIWNKQAETGDYKQQHVPEEYLEALDQECLQLCAELAEALRGECRTIDCAQRRGPRKRFLVPDPPEFPAAHKPE